VCFGFAVFVFPLACASAWGKFSAIWTNGNISIQTLPL
jgi:hypothetical protein